MKLKSSDRNDKFRDGLTTIKQTCTRLSISFLEYLNWFKRESWDLSSNLLNNIKQKCQIKKILEKLWRHRSAISDSFSLRKLAKRSCYNFLERSINFPILIGNYFNGSFLLGFFDNLLQP